MSNRRKTTPPRPRKPRFPIEALAPEIGAMVRTVAKAEKVSTSQAAIAALLAVSDVIGPVTALAEELEIDMPALDFEFLVPDPADRPAVRRAYRALVRSMPTEARMQAARSREAAEVAAGSMKAIPRGDAVTRLAAHYEQRDVYLVAAGPDQVPSALTRLAPITEATAYLDQGDSETVMSLTGHSLQVMPEIMEAAPKAVAAVWVIPKTVRAARLGRALAQHIPADGSRDLIMLTDGQHMAYPVILVEAIERVDPATAAQIRAGERDLILSHASPRTRALVDQADAAGAHAASILATMAEIDGGWSGLHAPSPLVRELVQRLPERALAGDVGLCPHLSPHAPQPAFWCVWDPATVRCGQCIGPATAVFEGTDEFNTCDYCRCHSERIHNSAALLPPVVADLGSLIAASGPVSVLFGLCPGCHAKAFPPGEHERDGA